MVLVDRGDLGIPQGYRNFAAHPERLIKPRAVSEFNWDPFSEDPLTVRQLENGVTLYFALSPVIQGFRTAARFDIGTNIHPGTHFLEHMMRYSRDVPDLRRRMNLSVVRCRGTTSPQHLAYAPELDNVYIGELAAGHPDFGMDTVNLLFAMTVRTDISEGHRQTEAERMRTESIGRQDSPILRFYDRILPAVADGTDRVLPTLETELSHTTADLQALHAALPFQTTVLEFSGNTGPSTDAQKTADLITSTADETFGRLAANHTYTTRDQKRGPFFSNYGTRVSVYPSYGFLSDYVGISAVTKISGDPKADYAERLFVFVLDEAFQRKMSREGLFYENFFSANCFDLDGIRLNFSGLRTSQPSRVIDASEETVRALLEMDPDPEVVLNFEAAKRGDIGFHFRTLGLARVRLSEELGLPTKNNCSALYELMRETDIETVLDSGRGLNQDNRLGLIHYGPSNIIPKPGFEFTTENALAS
jgi:hypothetical protein